MCGLVGFIGNPKDPKANFELLQSLLVKTEIRGDDASGYWAASPGAESDVTAYWSKAPLKASQFVTTKAWQGLGNVNTNIMIAHCRKSTCKGSENRNINNHPFVSDDHSVALVHNGNVPEFLSLKSEYDVNSECDSEILLRIVEQGSTYPPSFVKQLMGDVEDDNGKKFKDCEDAEIPFWGQRLTGIVDIFTRIANGAMAVAIGELWPDGTRALWLFRDKERPLHVVDMRQTQNVIYFVSDTKIWVDAVQSTTGAKKLVHGDTPIIEFPANYVWLFRYTPQNEFRFMKFKLKRERKWDTDFHKERPTSSELIARPSLNIKVVTNLDPQTHEVVGFGDQKKSSSAPDLTETSNGTQQTSGPASPLFERTQNPGITPPFSTTAPDKPKTTRTSSSSTTSPTNKNKTADPLFGGMIKWILGNTKPAENDSKSSISIQDIIEATKKESLSDLLRNFADTAHDGVYDQLATHLIRHFHWPKTRRFESNPLPLWRILKLARNSVAEKTTRTAAVDSHHQSVSSNGKSPNPSNAAKAVSSSSDDDGEGECSRKTNNYQNNKPTMHNAHIYFASESQVNAIRNRAYDIEAEVNQIASICERRLEAGELTSEEAENVLEELDDILSSTKSQLFLMENGSK